MTTTASIAVALRISTILRCLAYIDPGAGSIVLQGIVAALATILTAAAVYWRRFKIAIVWLAQRMSAKPQSENDDTELPRS